MPPVKMTRGKRLMLLALQAYLVLLFVLLVAHFVFLR